MLVRVGSWLLQRLMRRVRENRDEVLIVQLVWSASCRAAYAVLHRWTRHINVV
jgi:hypothetical protein